MDVDSHANLGRLLAASGPYEKEYPRAQRRLYRGRGASRWRRRVRVSREGRAVATLRAKVVLIATGSRPRRPAGAAFELPGVFDTDTILYRERGAPKAIVIVGGGAVGIEFATICRALGAKVTIVDRGERLATIMDGEISARMENLFRRVERRREVRLYGRRRRRERRRSRRYAFDARARRRRHGADRGRPRRQHRKPRARGGRRARRRARADRSGRATSGRRPTASTRPATSSNPRSPRLRWSRDARRSVPLSESRSKETWIRRRSRRSTACRNSRARALPRRRVASAD